MTRTGAYWGGQGKTGNESGIILSGMDEKEYLKLLDLLFQVVEANKGPITGDDDRYLDAEGLAAKFFMHAASILYLSRRIHIPDFPSTPVRFIDSASIDVLARTALETFLTFYYVFFAPKTKDEQDYRYLTYKGAGLAERQQLPVSTEENRQKLADEKTQLDDLCNKLRSNAIFRSLSQKQQSEVLTARRDIWRKTFVSGKSRLLSWTDIAINAGFSKMLAQDTYRYLSGYAHSSNASIMQIKELLKKEQMQLIEVPMNTINIATANLIDEYSRLFPRAKNALHADTGRGIVEEWIQIGQKLESEDGER